MGRLLRFGDIEFGRGGISFKFIFVKNPTSKEVLKTHNDETTLLLSKILIMSYMKRANLFKERSVQGIIISLKLSDWFN